MGRREVRLIDGDPHAAQPGVVLDRAEPEGEVAHPRAGVAALVVVRPRAAPVLLEEHPEPGFGRAEVLFRVEGAQHRIGGDLLVEACDDLVEDGGAADVVVEVAGHGHCSIVPSTSWAGATRPGAAGRPGRTPPTAS